MTTRRAKPSKKPAAARRMRSRKCSADDVLAALVESIQSLPAADRVAMIHHVRYVAAAPPKKRAAIFTLTRPES